MIRLLRLRRLMQVAVLLLLAALPWLNRDGFTGMKPSTFSGCRLPILLARFR